MWKEGGRFESRNSRNGECRFERLAFRRAIAQAVLRAEFGTVNFCNTTTGRMTYLPIPIFNWGNTCESAPHADTPTIAGRHGKRNRRSADGHRIQQRRVECMFLGNSQVVCGKG